MRIPRPGELYKHLKNKLYQIVTIATHSETGEQLVIYQALYGDYKTYARPLDMFISPVDKDKYPEATQTYRFELYNRENDVEVEKDAEVETDAEVDKDEVEKPFHGDRSSVRMGEEAIEQGEISQLLLDFLDESSMRKRLEIVTSNTKHITDRMVNDMAVALDCTVGDGPIEHRVQELIACLKAMSRFEDRRTR